MFIYFPNGIVYYCRSTRNRVIYFCDLMFSQRPVCFYFTFLIFNAYIFDCHGRDIVGKKVGMTAISELKTISRQFFVMIWNFDLFTIKRYCCFFCFRVYTEMNRNPTVFFVLLQYLSAEGSEYSVSFDKT